MYFSFGEFSSKVQLCFGLPPKSGYVSMLLAWNCLIPVSIMCTSLLCSSSRLDSGKTELPRVWIKASFSYLAHFKWQMHSIIVLLEIVQHFFPLLISLITKLHGKTLLSLNFVISKKTKTVQVSVPLPATGWPLCTGKADWLFLFIPACSFLLNGIIYFKTCMVC